MFQASPVSDGKDGPTRTAIPPQSSVSSVDRDFRSIDQTKAPPLIQNQRGILIKKPFFENANPPGPG